MLAALALTPPEMETLTSSPAIDQWRAETPGCAHRNHLNNAGAAFMPQPVIDAMTRGAAEYHRFLEWSRHPLMVAVNIVGFLFLVLHAVTWFNLAPQAMVVHVGRRRVPGVLIAASNYAALVVVSAVILALLLLRW